MSGKSLKSKTGKRYELIYSIHLERPSRNQIYGLLLGGGYTGTTGNFWEPIFVTAIVPDSIAQFTYVTTTKGRQSIALGDELLQVNDTNVFNLSRRDVLYMMQYPLGVNLKFGRKKELHRSILI